MNVRRGVGIMGHLPDRAAAWFWARSIAPGLTTVCPRTPVASSNSAQIQANSEATTVFTILTMLTVLIETGSLQKTKCVIFCSAIISQHASVCLCVVLC